MAQVSTSVINAKDYTDCLDYIDKYWEKITCFHPIGQFVHLSLPHKFICPNDGIYKNDQFYWDSYFIILGLVRSGRTELAKGMIDNFLYLQKRFNIIPMRNRYYNLGTSQMPFLTSMIREVYYVTKDTKWYKATMHGAEYELNDYWMNKHRTELHLIYKDLSRYCDHFITHLAAEHESGWDMTSRFKSHCLDYLPVDLNCGLYKYETDLAEFYKANKNTAKYKHYLYKSEQRRKVINKLMWNEEKGFYFDYNYKTKKQSAFYSVAGFYPLWARLADYTQARKMVDALARLEYDGGIANTQPKGLAKVYKQHDYPNGWPQQQWIVVKGLMNYGFRKDAIRIAKKYLDLCKKIYRETGKIWEKYDVVRCSIAKSERYPTQSGFGWTNAVIVRLLSKFEKS